MSVASASNNSFDPGFSPDLYVVPNRPVRRRTSPAFAHLAWAGMPDGPVPRRRLLPGQPVPVPRRRDLARTVPGQAVADHQAWPTTRTSTRRTRVSRATRANNYSYPTLPKPDAGGHWVRLFVFTPAVEMNLPFRRDEYYSTKGVALGVRDRGLSAAAQQRRRVHRTRRLATRRLPGRPDHADPVAARSVRAEPAGRARRDAGSRPDAVVVPRRGQPDDRGADVRRRRRRAGSATRWWIRSTPPCGGTASRSGRRIRPKQQTFAVPADEATYELSKVIKRSEERFKLSTEISSKWTFRSRRTPDGVESALPMMNVRYSPVLDERNRAAGGRFEVPLTVEHQYGAKASAGRFTRRYRRPSIGGKTWRHGTGTAYRVAAGRRRSTSRRVDSFPCARPPRMPRATRSTRRSSARTN